MSGSFNIDGARKAGYSDAEIAPFLASQRGFDIDAARKAGYNDGEITSFLTSAPKHASPDVTPDQAARQSVAAPVWTEAGPYAGGSEERAQQTQVGADINAVGQGVVQGTGGAIAGVGRSAQAGIDSNIKAQIAAMDAIDAGKEVPQDQDPVGYQFLSPEQRTKIRAELTDVAAAQSKHEPNALMRAGMAVQEAAPGIFPVSPENEGFQTRVLRTVGGVVPALLATAATGPVGLLAGMATIGAQSYDSTYQDAVAHGASDEEAVAAAGKNALAQAVTGAIPVGRLLQRIPVPWRDGLAATLINLGQHGVEFGTFNALGTFANNYVASQTYDPTRPWMQGTGQAGLEGFVAGLIIPAVQMPFRLSASAPRDPESTATKVMDAPDINSAALVAKEESGAPAPEAPGAPRVNFGRLFTPAAERVAAQAPDASAPSEPALSYPPKNAIEAKAIASAYYHIAEQSGATLSPEFTNKFIARAEDIAPQTPEGRAVAGDTEVTGLIERLQDLRDQPISLRGAQEIDEKLGDLIDKEYGMKGLSKEGYNLFKLQTTFRDMIMNVDPSMIEGGMEGFDALKSGRAAWSQAMKMMDLERIQTRSELIDNPSTAIRTGIRTLLANQPAKRGYSPDEIEALKEAANRGFLGGILHVFGSRLIPIGAGAAGSIGGPLSAAVHAGVAYAGSTVARNTASALQNNRLNKAISVIAGSTPKPPDLTPQSSP